MTTSRILKSVLTAGVCALALATGAQAQSRNFNVPAGDLGAALSAYSAQSGTELIYRSEDLRGLRTVGVRGSMDQAAALEALLAQTGISWERQPSGAIAVKRAAPARPQAAVSAATQDAAPPGPDAYAGLEEVTVTARRVAENIQDVPIAITAFGADELRRKDVTDLNQLTNSTPGLNLCCGQNNAGFYINIRGIEGGAAPVYFNGVPLVTAASGVPNGGGFSSTFDISSVQVLKGPQGTNFGLAANAGAIVYESRKPGERFGGYVSGTLGNYSRIGIEGAVDAPLMDGRILTRLSFKKFSRDGYIHDLRNNKNYVNQDYYVIRPQATFKITDKLTHEVFLQYYEFRSNGNESGWVLRDFNFNNAQNVGATNAQIAANGGNAAAFNALREQALLRQQQLGLYTIDGLSVGCNSKRGPTFQTLPITNLNYPRVACPGNSNYTAQTINTTTYEFSDNWLIKNIFGYSWGSGSVGQPGDTDGTPLALIDGNPTLYQSQPVVKSPWTDEFQIIGTDVGGMGLVDVLLGTFHMNFANDSSFGQFSSTPAGVTSVTYNNIGYNSHAVYGNANWHLDSILEGLSASTGIRYTKDKRKQETLRYLYSANAPGFRGALASRTGGAGTPAGEGEWSNTSYNLSLQYQVTPQTMLFLTNAKGYSSGGLQSIVGFERYEPDSLNNIEAGFKSTFEVGGMLTRLNASVYRGVFSNIKVPVWTLITNSNTGLLTAQNVTRNAAEAVVQGFEAELDVVPTDSLRLGGFVSYNANKYSSWPQNRPVAPFDLIDTKDTPFGRNAKWKFGANADYQLPLEETLGEVHLTGDLTYRTKLPIESAPYVPLDPTNPRTGFICTRDRTAANGYPASLADGSKQWIDCRPPKTELTLGVSWRNVLDHPGVSLNFVVTNVTKNTVSEGTCTCDKASSLTSITPAAPRMWSLTARYEY